MIGLSGSELPLDRNSVARGRDSPRVSISLEANPSYLAGRIISLAVQKPTDGSQCMDKYMLLRRLHVITGGLVVSIVSSNAWKSGLID